MIRSGICTQMQILSPVPISTFKRWQPTLFIFLGDVLKRNIKLHESNLWYYEQLCFVFFSKNRTVGIVLCGGCQSVLATSRQEIISIGFRFNNPLNQRQLPSWQGHWFTLTLSAIRITENSFSVIERFRRGDESIEML